MAPLSGPSVGAVRQAKGENIGRVIRFLVVHQSGQAEGNQPATGPRTTKTTHTSYIVTVIIVKGGGGNLTLMSRGLVVITGLVG